MDLGKNAASYKNITLKVKQLTFWNIDNLYLIIGGLLGFSSFGFLYYYIIDRKYEELKCCESVTLIKYGAQKRKCEEEIRFESEKENNIAASEITSPKLSRRNKIIFIILMATFNFFFAGVEGSFKNYIPAFGTQCNLNLSRQEKEWKTGSFSTIFYHMSLTSILRDGLTMSGPTVCKKVHP